MNDKPNEIMNIQGRNMKGKINVLDRSLEELKTDLVSLGEKQYRAEQVFQWLYKGVSSFSEMTNLSKVLIQKLQNHFSTDCLQHKIGILRQAYYKVFVFAL